MDLGFGGDVVDYYQQYRRGYPAPVVDVLTGALGLTGDDIAIDLGCGTGQLTLPVAGRVRAVLGVDPEPDMVRRARQVAIERGIGNIGWLLGSDADVGTLTALLGERTVGAVTIAQALHWMDHDQLFRRLVPLLRPAGGVAVVANGVPLWLQDSDWSRRLRGFLQDWLGSSLSNTCGTDDKTRLTYRDSLAAAGFATELRNYDYTDELDLRHLVGGVLSAVPLARLPAATERAAFAERIRQAVAPAERFTEQVSVSMVIGRLPASTG